MNLVHYCPGSAVGSPGWMQKDLADAQLVKDTRYVCVMNSVGAMDKIIYPHIGGECDKCSRRKEDVHQK